MAVKLNINNAIDLFKSKGGDTTFEYSLRKTLEYAEKDKRITSLSDLAYLLATAEVESNYSLQRWEADYLCGKQGYAYQDKPAGSGANARTNAVLIFDIELIEHYLLMHIFSELSQIVFPTRCYGCNALGVSICTSCRREWIPHYYRTHIDALNVHSAMLYTPTASKIILAAKENGLQGADDLLITAIIHVLNNARFMV